MNAIAETAFTLAIDRTFQLFARAQLPAPEEVDAFLKDVGPLDFAPATLIGTLSNAPSFAPNSDVSESHLRSMGLAGALVLNSKLNTEGGSESSRYSAANLAFNKSLQRRKLQSWYSALIKQKALRYLADNNKTTQSDRKLMVNDLVTNLTFSALDGNVPAAHQFFLNVSNYSNKQLVTRICVILVAAKVETKKVKSVCKADLIAQKNLQNQLVETLTETEKKQRRLLSSKFSNYSSVMCATQGRAIEDRLRCTTKLSAAIELCRVTDVAAQYKVLEGQFLCDKRALGSISNIVDNLFKQMPND